MDIQKEIEKKIQDETKKEQKVFSLNSIKLDKTPRPAQIKLLDFTKQCVMSNKKYMIIDAPVGIGKAQPLSSLVMTTDGFKPMGDLTYNDKIITPKGNAVSILKLHDIHELPVYEITFKDGRKTQCTEQHLWTTFSYSWEKWKTKTTAELIEYLNTSGKKKRNKIYIPLVTPAINTGLEVSDMPIDPYLLGCLLGDGGLTQAISFASDDEFIINKLNLILSADNLICKKYSHQNYRIISTQTTLRKNSLIVKLRELNLMGKKSEDKIIPEIYMNGNLEVKLKLLQGLFDTDGSISKDGSIFFGSSSLEMITQIQELLQSIGGIAELKEKKCNYEYKHEKNVKKHYKLNIRLKDRSSIFSLPRKIERCSGTYQYSELKLAIKSIKLIGTDKTRCISIDDSDQLYITDNYIVTHNSYFSVMFMDWFKHNYDMTAQFDILTNSKILQEQYTNDFDFMNSLWGKGSYQCDTYDTDCATGSEWCRIQNKQCDSCPYAEAKWKFDMGDVSLTNFHLFLTYMFYMPMAWKRRSRVLIIDEAHSFDNVVCDFITTKISKPLLKRNGFTDEETKNAINVFGKNPENLSPEEFVNIIKDDFLPIVKSVINRLASESEEGNIQAANFLQSLNNNFMKWDILYQEYNNLPDNWIVEIEKQKKYNKEGSLTDEYYEFTAQPVWAYPYLESKIWNKYDYVIFMSGTILDKKMYSDMNGFDVSMSDYISIDSPFPVENRPIYYFYNTGKQSFKTKELTWERQHPILKKILKKHKNSKGIIHTANYEIQGWVEQKFNESRILTHASDNRNDVLQHHYNSDEPTVLVSPSMMTGVDLHDEYSRHQTILKVPYPNLGSKKVKKRMETNDKWYGWATVCDLIQMYGRSIRSAEDNADTYVLDSCFGDVLKWNGHYFPKWVKEAIHYIE